MSRHILIASSDITLINEMNEQLLTRDFSVSIEKSCISSVLTVLIQKIEFMIVDIDSFNTESMDYIRILKHIRPQLPLVVLSSDNSLEKNSVLKELGIFYIGIKPVNTLEFTMVIDAISLLNTKKSTDLMTAHRFLDV